MECRTPLFELVPVPKLPHSRVQHSPSWSSRTPSSAAAPPPPPVKRRLPLPKNVVLLSLIQATELASQDARLKYTESPRSELQTRGSMLDEDEEEEERIQWSTSLAVGKAGTYAVAFPEGLLIYPSRPSQQNDVIPDVESLVRVYHHKDDEVPGGPVKQKQLSYGDRIQVVSVEGGWAKLARGYGFVRAEKNHLVKGRLEWRGIVFPLYLAHSFILVLIVVGGAVDRACKVEAVLCSLSHRRKELRMEQSKIDNHFIRFINELQHSLQHDEDLTVILADTFAAPTEASPVATMELATIEKEEKTVEVDPGPPKPARPSTSPAECLRPSRFACFSGGVFGTDDDIGGDRLLRFSFSHDFLRSSQEEADPEASQLFPVTTHPSPSAMRAGAQAWRELQRTPSNGETGINFRTGMSGHLALLSTHAHPHQYLTPARAGRMSAHTGLTMPRGSWQSLLSSWTLPSTTSDPAPLPPSGSM
jgi:hypothetical protein